MTATRHLLILVGLFFLLIPGVPPQHQFLLYDQERKYDPAWYGSSHLNSFHPIDDIYYEFRLVENGKKVAARPCRWEFGYDLAYCAETNGNAD